MSNSSHRRLLVTGAAGKLGRRIVDLLAEAGARGLVAGSRDPSKLAAPNGIERRRVDFDDPTSLAAAFGHRPRADHLD
jgi:NAD(P)H dehydrogenase (quinone)